LTHGSYPLQSIGAASRSLANATHAAAQSGRYDLIHVEHVRALQYVPARPRIPVLFDAVDCVSHLFELAAVERRGAAGWLFRVEARRTARLEAIALAAADRVIVASEREAVELRKRTCGTAIGVVTNPVDLRRLTPGPAARSKTVVMSGKMSFHANALAARRLCSEIWPLVHAQHPDATLVIAGAAPSASLRRQVGPNTVLTGYVADMARVLRSAAVSVAPMPYAVGVQNKILEALACATPVVATQAAAGDLRLRHGRELLIAEGSEALAARISFLLSNPDLARRIGNAGRRFVEAHHDVDMVADRLEEQYLEVVHRKRERGAAPQPAAVSS